MAATALCLAVAGFSLSTGAQTRAAEVSSPPTAESRTIVAVRILGEDGAVLEENPSNFPVAAGRPFDSAQVREALKQLFRSGRFSDVQAETADAAGGLRLDFVVVENYFINRVRVIGLEEPPTEGVAISVMRLNLGEAFTDAKLEEARARLAQLLEDESFYQAVFTFELQRKPETRQIDILAVVDPGKRARVGEIHVKNETPFRDARLIRRTRLKKGKGATSIRRTRGADRLRRYLLDQGYLGSRVSVRRGPYSREADTVVLELEAFAGSRVRVEVAGASVSESDLRDLIPIYQEGAVDDDLLREGQRNLRAHFEHDGYFDTMVTYSVAEEEGVQVIRYQVARGERRSLAGIEIVGNQYFSNALLLGRMQIVPAAFLTRGRFSTRLMEAEVASMLAVYDANGFTEAQVRSELVQDYGGKKGHLLVRFHVEEGPQTLVSDLAIEGNAALDDDFLMSYVSSTPGQPFSEFNLGGDRNNILALYLDSGFPEVRVEAESAPAEEPNRMRVIYRVTEGPQARVHRVLLDGEEFTRRDRIAREVTITAGAPLRQGDVIETQRQLYELGIFNRVQVAPQNPDGSEASKTIVVLVDEAKRYTIAYGAGIEFQRLESRSNPGENELRVSPRGLFEISKNNVLGRAHTVAFKARASTLQGRGLLSYAAPAFLNRDSLTFLFTALYDKTSDVSTFSAQRYEAGAQVAFQSSPFTTTLFRYSFRRVVVDPDSLKIDPQEVPLFSQPTRISGPGLTWIHDRRDNPADATRGHFNTLDFSFALTPLGSSADFTRVFLQNSTFHPLGRTLVFARSVRFGVQQPFSSTTATDIPLPERFFAGGGYSLRGFGLNQAGPRDPVTGFPIGGQALLVFNNEIRFPMRIPKLEKMGGAIFYDAGNVFSKLDAITFRWEPALADVSSGRLNYFSHTIGFSFRYPTPVGPVRLDLGYLLNPSLFSTDDGMTGPVFQRLPRFQFFLTIGPNF